MKSWLKTIWRPTLAFLAAIIAAAVGSYLGCLAAPTVVENLVVAPAPPEPIVIDNLKVVSAPPGYMPDGSKAVVESSNLDRYIGFLKECGCDCALYAFLWIPVVFAAYAAGRRRFSIALLFAFATAEGIAFGLANSLRAGVW